MTRLTSFATTVLLALAPAYGLAAQTGAETLASQTLGRGYTHMFWAYALAWILVFAWTVSIARRLARVEKRLEE